MTTVMSVKKVTENDEINRLWQYETFIKKFYKAKNLQMRRNQKMGVVIKQYEPSEVFIKECWFYSMLHDEFVPPFSHLKPKDRLKTAIGGGGNIFHLELHILD